MHPTVVSDKPGECPICGMDLVLINRCGQAGRFAVKQRAPDLFYRSRWTRQSTPTSR
jgi:hypothetical protein